MKDLIEDIKELICEGIDCYKKAAKEEESNTRYRVSTLAKMVCLQNLMYDVKLIEEKHKQDASFLKTMLMEIKEEVEGQSRYDTPKDKYWKVKIQGIRAHREATGASLREAKEAVEEALPRVMRTPED